MTKTSQEDVELAVDPQSQIGVNIQLAHPGRSQEST